jgi:SAM-dependent methyltransferase
VSQYGTEDALAGFQRELKELIKRYLGVPALSHSSQNGIQTGNNYQSVLLGEEATAGFRTLRAETLAGAALKEKTVLDLGSNLGEISRLAGRLGASTVLGYEYDPFFVKVAKAVNLYNDVDNVRFMQGDIADLDRLDGSFDVVLAFSVYEYLGKNFEVLTNLCRSSLVLETHIFENAEGLMSYVDKIRTVFPYFCLYQLTEHNNLDPRSGKRAMFWCSKDEERGFLERRSRDPALTKSQTIQFSLTRSDLHVFEGLDAEYRFRSGLDFKQRLELLAKVEVPWDKLQAEPGLFSQRTPYYWLAYARGYTEFKDASDNVAPSNSFVALLAELKRTESMDPGVAAVATSEEELLAVARRRFEMLDRSADPANDDAIVIYNLVTYGHRGENDIDDVLKLVGVDRFYSAQDIDGWHRLFAAILHGRRSVRAIVAVDNARIGQPNDAAYLVPRIRTFLEIQRVTEQLGEAAAEDTPRSARLFSPMYFNSQHPRFDKIPSVFGGMWTDRKDWAKVLESKIAAGHIGESTARQVQKFAQDGFVVLPGVIPRELIQQIKEDVQSSLSAGASSLRAETQSAPGRLVPITELSADERAGFTKLFDLHAESEALRLALMRDDVHQFMRAVLQETPKTIQSLVQRGTLGHAAQKDSATVAIDSNPRGLIAVWIPLDDDDLLAESLHCHTESHKAGDFVFGKQFKWMDAFPKDKDLFHHELKKAGRLTYTPVSPKVRAGDILIMHADLTHHGSGNGRGDAKSIFVHVTGKSEVPLYQRQWQRRALELDKGVFVSKFHDVG